MKLLRVACFGIRGVPDLDLDLSDPATRAPHPVVLVTGGPASGKTRLLQAIAAAKEALGPYGPLGPARRWIDRGGVARMILGLHLDAEEQTYAGARGPALEGEVIFLEEQVRITGTEGLSALLERYAHDPAVGKVEYFPASRAVPTLPPFHRLDPAEQRGRRLPGDDRKYAFVPRFLQEIGADPVRARAFADLLSALSATCRYTPEGNSGRCLSSRGGPAVTVTQLSSGEADAVLFAAAATGLGLDRSILLVDRPEIHAGLAGARRLAAALGAPARDNQLLLASGAAALPAALPSAHIVRLG